MSDEKEPLSQDVLDAIEHINDDDEVVKPGTETLNDESSVDVDSGAESSEEAQDTEEPTTWIDDSVISLAQSFGFSEGDLSDFKDREDFDRNLRRLDRYVSLRLQRDQPTQPDAQPEAKPDQPQFERVKLDPNEYDESLVKAFDGIQDQVESQLKVISELQSKLTSQQQAATEQEHAQLVNRFESWVDDLSNEELFGPTDFEKRTLLQNRNRQLLWEQTHLLQKQGPILDQQIGFDKTAVGRAYNLAFYEHVERQRQKETGKKLIDQSKKRMGGGQPTKAPPQTWNGEPETNPVILEAYKQYVNENGTGY